MPTFYGVVADAAALSGLAEADISSAIQQLVNTIIDSEVRPAGFGTTTVTDETYDILPNQNHYLILKNIPIIEITEVNDNIRSDPYTLNPDNYVVNPNTGILILDRFYSGNDAIKVFTKGAANVSVSYTHGFATVPDIIVQLANLLAAKMAKIFAVNNVDSLSIASGVKIGNYEEKGGTLSGINAVKSEFDSNINSLLVIAKATYATGV